MGRLAFRILLYSLPIFWCRISNCFLYLWLSFISSLAYGIEELYYKFYRFVFRRTKAYETLKKLEKRYLPQEELIAAKIKSQSGRGISWNATPNFLSKNSEFFSYAEKAQEKIGSAYPVLKSDIEKAKEIITNRYRKSETAFADNTYQPSSKTTTAKKAPSKVKLRPQSSSSTINAASSQSSSSSNLKSPSRTLTPSINVSRKAKPVQPRLTNWKKVNLSRLEIGEQGEELVLQYEQRRLERIGLGHLVEKIEHSSKVVGDGLGYDIKSFDRQGQTIYIEVKTTRDEFWNNLIFTRNKLDVMKRIDQQYVLYRVYCLDDEGNGEISMMRGYGEISKHFSFIPQSFVAKHKGTTN